jgi:hypothetical protein
LRIFDCLVDSPDFAAQGFGGNQAGGIIPSAIDPQAGTQAFKPGLHVELVCLEFVDGLNRGNICINASHGILPDCRGKRLTCAVEEHCLVFLAGSDAPSHNELPADSGFHRFLHGMV